MSTLIWFCNLVPRAEQCHRQREITTSTSNGEQRVKSNHPTPPRDLGPIRIGKNYLTLTVSSCLRLCITAHLRKGLFFKKIFAVLLQEIETWAIPLMKKTRRSGWSRRVAVARWGREAARSLGGKYKCSSCQNLLVYLVQCFAPDIHILLESSSMFCRIANSWMDGPSK